MNLRCNAWSFAFWVVWSDKWVVFARPISFSFHLDGIHRCDNANVPDSSIHGILHLLTLSVWGWSVRNDDSGVLRLVVVKKLIIFVIRARDVCADFNWDPLWWRLKCGTAVLKGRAVAVCVLDELCVVVNDHVPAVQRVVLRQNVISQTRILVKPDFCWWAFRSFVRE